VIVLAQEGPTGLMLGELEVGLLGGRKSSVEAFLASSGGFLELVRLE